MAFEGLIAFLFNSTVRTFLFVEVRILSCSSYICWTCRFHNYAALCRFQYLLKWFKVCFVTSFNVNDLFRVNNFALSKLRPQIKCHILRSLNSIVIWRITQGNAKVWHPKITRMLELALIKFKFLHKHIFQVSYRIHISAVPFRVRINLKAISFILEVLFHFCVHLPLL